MHWTTMRVLVKNLGELMEQMASGEHMVTVPAVNTERMSLPEREAVKESWRLGLVSTSTALAKLLHLGNETRFVNPEWQEFRWTRREQVNENPYVMLAQRLLPVARKLISDYDEQLRADERKSRGGGASPAKPA